MRNGEPQIYTSLVIMRNGYMQFQWNRVQMFLVFNSIALPLMFGAIQAAQPELVKFIVSIVGLWLHIALLIAARRADNWIKYFDGRLMELELLDRDDPNGTRVLVFSHPDFTAIRYSWFASRRVFGTVGIAVTVTWFEEVIRYCYLLFR